MIALRQDFVRLYNRTVRERLPVERSTRELLRRARAVTLHPYWRDHPYSIEARVELARAAAAAPGGEPEVRQHVVDGRLEIVEADDS
ncbi:hypothetical protein [Streptomyces sp. NRRL S-87]|uniref:hypothetical protein n=1 Tax=Streptomyces sp. NRRL S-87 TaxID=1463920 RepID=UPI0004C17D40|nr:hypothetical protein [Streptomyces sp. NRRL S-87]